jgi:hypothetical protein
MDEENVNDLPLTEVDLAMELLFDSSDSSLLNSSSDSCENVESENSDTGEESTFSDDDYEMKKRLSLLICTARNRIPKLNGFVKDVVHSYSDELVSTRMYFTLYYDQCFLVFILVVSQTISCVTGSRLQTHRTI